ncbi:MAG: CRTAC1 family protein [Planctomycetaceae bacterium]
MSSSSSPATLFRILPLAVAMIAIAGCDPADEPTSSGGAGSSANSSGTAVGNGNQQGAVAAEPDLTRDEFRQAIRLRNRGIAHLENSEWADAEASLSQLADLLPGNMLAERDLAILRVLSIIANDAPYKPTGSPDEVLEYHTAIEMAQAAVSSYRNAAKTDYDRALADMLMGKLLAHTAEEPEQTRTAIELLQAAADAQPAAPDFRYAVALAMDQSREYSESAQLIQTLQQTFQMAPQNFSLLQKLMHKQAVCLNSPDDETRKAAAGITGTLTTATELLAPLNELVKKRHRVDVIDTLKKALGKSADNPAALTGPAMMASNLIVAEVATQIDQRRVDRHLLEYVLLDFDDDFMAAAREAGALDDAAVPETVVKSFTQAAIEGLPSGVTQLQCLDFDLNGFDDLIVIRDGRFEVWSRGEDLQAAWTLLLSAPLDTPPARGFLLADIDRDDDRNVSELKSPRLLRDRDGDQKIVSDPAGERRWYDADFDVVLWTDAGVRVFRNETDESGRRHLTPLPQTSDVPDVRTATAADLDADGDLDLVFGTAAGVTLWQNLDRTNFADLKPNAALPAEPVTALAGVDWDRNVAMDVIAAPADPSAKGGLVENMMHARFRWQTSGTGLDGIAGATGLAVGQFDNRQGWDVAAAGPGGLTVTLVRGGAGSPLAELKTTRLTESAMVGVQTADIDNDGRSDLIAWSDDGVKIFRSHGDGTFEDLSSLCPALQSISDVTATDFDDDGDLDIIVAGASGSSTGASVLLNDGGNTNQWITVVCRAKPDDPQVQSQRANLHATGAVIEVRCGSDYQAHVINEPKLHIGLGTCSHPDAIRVIWTDGIPQNITVPELLTAKLGILAPQILHTSCPYIYTWTGERFEFFSDCLWAAPLGLVQASGELAPTREWENLLIPGSSLVENNGRYMLQLTEELWEAAYFDQVELTAIDHPADVDIFTNEKVGPPQLAEHRIHTVRKPLLPVSITDGRGNDLLPGLTSQDGDYVQAFQARVMQGLVDEWTMEFDLGSSAIPDTSTDGTEATATGSVRLFLIGWVFPTDTSLNFAIEQNADLQPPLPPLIEVPDGHGGWKTALPFIGFPSGKTKAMVIDLSDVVDADTTKFRIRSSMELYWDQAFFTVDEPDAPTVAHDCPLVDADLHYRGFSRRTYGDNALFRNGRAPEGYDYDAVISEPAWPAMSGRFTRYGQVAPLLIDHDDTMVVMGAGDEMTVSFAVPETPPPAGWTRDFVLRNVGYDKDANLGTIYGQSSEPYPFKAMTSYPFAADDSPPQTPDYVQWLNEYQTRTMPSRRFWTTFRSDSSAIPSVGNPLTN